MAKEVWGTFSVKDHCDPDAFIAEVMLYDRLVVPIPTDSVQRTHWSENRWDPDLLDKLLEILGERALPIPWTKQREENWRQRFDAEKSLAAEWAFAATRSELIAGLPSNVTGVQVVTNFPTINEMERELRIKPIEATADILSHRSVMAILGSEFLVPENGRLSHEDRLKQAVELSSDVSAGRKRAAFWRWQRDFFADYGGIINQATINAAIEEMNDLLEEQKASIRRQRIKTVVQFSFMAGSVVLGVCDSPLTQYVIGGAFASVGQFMAEYLPSAHRDQPSPVSLVHDARKHFGWT